MSWAFVVEGKAIRCMANLYQAAIEGLRRKWRGRDDVGRHKFLVGRLQRILREGVQNIREDQFLVLLLVIDSQFDKCCSFWVNAVGQKIEHRFISMPSIGGDLVGGRPRQQSTLRTRVPLANSFIVGIEEVRVGRIEDLTMRTPRKDEVFKEPRRVRAV